MPERKPHRPTKHRVFKYEEEHFQRLLENHGCCNNDFCQGLHEAHEEVIFERGYNQAIDDVISKSPEEVDSTKQPSDISWQRIDFERGFNACRKQVLTILEQLKKKQGE